MKKILILSGIVFLFIFFGIFMIQIRKQDTDITKNKTKVGFILNGTVDDHSWGESHYIGMENCAEKLNLEVIYKECVPEEESCVNTIEELINVGCKIIICNSFGYGEWELECANRHPEIYFYHATGVQELNNMSTYFGRIYQMRYLSGIVAGLQTQTNEIGYVAAFPIAEVNRGINAFTLGVRSVNPEAKVFVRWSNAWHGDEETEVATRKLISDHNIDVIAMHSDSIKVLEVAEKEGIWSIGYNLDNSKLFPNTFLTAPVWNWEKFYNAKIFECLQGKFQGIHYWEGVETGLVDLAPFTSNVKPEAIERVKTEREHLMSGMFDVFYGPIVDNEGNVRVKANESMSDDAMLDNFFWYVEGVVVDENE